MVVAAIERYSVSGDVDEFAGIECACKKIWQTEIELDRSIPIPLGIGLRRRGDSVQNLRSL